MEEEIKEELTCPKCKKKMELVLTERIRMVDLRLTFGCIDCKLFKDIGLKNVKE